jgi:uncharacterized protein (TIGR02118 family)
MIKLLAMIKRKDGLTPEEFHRHWREVHGPLIRATKSGSYVVRYEQHHRPLDDYGNRIVSDYDGVTVQWFRSMEDFYASIAEPDYAEIAADVERFIDSASIVWLLTEDAEVIIE